MPVTLSRFGKQIAPARRRAANDSSVAAPTVHRGPWAKPVPTAGRTTPAFKTSYAKLAAWGGVLILSALLWWALIRAIVALIGVIR